MAFESWLLLALAINVASISPGPNVLIVVINTLKHGFRGGLFSILGNLVCLFCVSLLAAFGVGALLATTPIALMIMKVAGGLYLAWLGFKMIRASFAKQQEFQLGDVTASKENVSAFSLMTEAFLISASNPKSVLFLSAIMPQFLTIEKPMVPQFVIMFATIIGSVFIVHSCYGFIASRLSQRPVSQRIRRWMSRVCGGTFIGLGVGVALSK